MASAIVLGTRPSGEIGSGTVGIVLTVQFSGVDVESDMQGQAFEILVRLPFGYDFAALKDAMGDAVQALAAEYGWTVDKQDIDIPSFEHGA